MSTFISKLILFIFLFQATAFAGSPIIWRGTSAEMLPSSLKAVGLCTLDINGVLASLAPGPDGNVATASGGVWTSAAPSGTVGAAFQEVPAGVVNDVNTNFTLAHTPGVNSSLTLYLDGLALNQGVDYTLAGNAITMTTAPNFNQKLYAVYAVVAGASGGVSDINGVTGSVNILAGTGISVGTVGQNITITNTSGSPLAVSGTSAAPNLITAAGGISFASSTPFNKQYIKGNGGAVVVTANPQIAACTVDGQTLTLQSVDAVNTVEIQNGNGLATNGPWIGGLNSSITFSCDLSASLWVEASRQ